MMNRVGGRYKALVTGATGLVGRNLVEHLCTSLWPRIAELFEMKAGGVQEVRLAELMSPREPVWNELVDRHDLKRNAMDALASWPFADLIFSLWWDDVSSTVKARKHGFHGATDTESMFMEQLAGLRRERVIP